MISIENLSKVYRIGLRDEMPDTFVGALKGMARRPLRNFQRLRRVGSIDAEQQDTDMLWALRDVSFEVAEGEVVGIIGRNGAGKSTLLKILSRITHPSSGRAVLRGRVSSLLEVGTGFHPELTGRENIYMNGTILGMRKKEIDSKFDEIVDFSGVEKFLDTPTKRYSSGMKVRLAFAVAAHLEPEILIIDEVLAVGDAEFQKKCLGKMQDVAAGGRTVLFVSHNMGAVESLCSRAIMLAGGKVSFEGEVKEVCSEYLQLFQKSLNKTGYYVPSGSDLDENSSPVALEEAKLVDAQGKQTGSIRFGEPFSIKMRWRNEEFVPGLTHSVRFFDSKGNSITACNTLQLGDNAFSQEGIHEVECKISNNCFAPGEYSLRITASAIPHTRYARHENALGLSIEKIAWNENHQYTLDGNPAFAVKEEWNHRILTQVS